MIARYLRWLRRTHGIGVYGDVFYLLLASNTRHVHEALVIDWEAEAPELYEE